jgi:hypothetical protein
MAGLNAGEIHKVVTKYIGVSGGYLGDFNYREHREFYKELDLSIDPDRMPGTTRERFIAIIESSPSDVVSRILTGVLARFPAGSPAPVGSKAERTVALHDEIAGWAKRLRGAAPVAKPDLAAATTEVLEALADAEKIPGPNQVDRLHTALHGYLRQAGGVN